MALLGTLVERAGGKGAYPLTEAETRARIGTGVSTASNTCTVCRRSEEFCQIDGRVGRDEACWAVGQRSSENFDANPGVGKLAQAGVGGE